MSSVVIWYSGFTGGSRRPYDARIAEKGRALQHLAAFSTWLARSIPLSDSVDAIQCWCYSAVFRIVSKTVFWIVFSI